MSWNNNPRRGDSIDEEEGEIINNNSASPRPPFGGRGGGGASFENSPIPFAGGRSTSTDFGRGNAARGGRGGDFAANFAGRGGDFGRGGGEFAGRGAVDFTAGRNNEFRGGRGGGRRGGGWRGGGRGFRGRGGRFAGRGSFRRPTDPRFRRSDNPNPDATVSGSFRGNSTPFSPRRSDSFRGGGVATEDGAGGGFARQTSGSFRSTSTGSTAPRGGGGMESGDFRGGGNFYRGGRGSGRWYRGGRNNNEFGARGGRDGGFAGAGRADAPFGRGGDNAYGGRAEGFNATGGRGNEGYYEPRRSPGARGAGGFSGRSGLPVVPSLSRQSSYNRRSSVDPRLDQEAPDYPGAIQRTSSADEGRTRDWYSSSPQSSPQIGRQPPATEPVAPVQQPMLTSSLADDGRAEKVVRVVHEMLDIQNEEEGQLSTLPSKDQILKAVEKLDDVIKESKKEEEQKEQEVQAAKQSEEDQRQKIKEDAMQQAKKQAEESIRAEEERRSSKVKAHDADVEDFVKEKTSKFDEAQSELQSELDSEVKAAKDEEMKKMRVAMNEQMISTADHYDQELDKVRKDFDKASNHVRKTENKLNHVEKDYHKKLEQIETDDAVEPSDLVARIIAENRQKAAQAHMNQLTYVVSEEDEMEDEETAELRQVRDPKMNRTMDEWAEKAKSVTGLENALYTDPTDAPYYKHNEKLHELIAPCVREFIIDKNKQLNMHWTELAEEYSCRKTKYDKMKAKRSKRTTKHIIDHSSMILNNSKPIVARSNPYRRPRREAAKSDYEQEQLIAKMAAKEALEKRAAIGGCVVPRQIGEVERQLNGRFLQNFTSQRVDVVEQERELAHTNVWSDMEKAIFLDRWLQFPKDFKKIATFLRNKTTKDCVRFYYDSKQHVPYKQALREHFMRRKRRGDAQVWDATIEAALSVGIIVKAGPSEEKPLVFLLPENDNTYVTRKFHPMKQEVLEEMEIDEDAAAAYLDHSDDSSGNKKRRAAKRSRGPMFVLDPAEAKYIKTQGKKTDKVQETDGSITGTENEDGTPSRRSSAQKWSREEKRVYHEVLETHGKNWEVLEQALGKTKTPQQIRKYYYDHEKKLQARTERRRADAMVREQNDAQDAAGATSSAVARAHHEQQVADYLRLQQHEAEIRQRNFENQQQQQQQQHRSDYELYQRQISEAERSLSRSGTSTPDAMDLWAAQQQRQNLDAARRLLGQQTQSHVNNLLPHWQLLENQNSSWENQQQLQNILQLEQQRQQRIQSQNALLRGLAESLYGPADEIALAQHIIQLRQNGQTAEALELLQRAGGRGSGNGNGNNPPRNH